MTVARMLKTESVAAEVIAQALSDAGIDMVFGMSGGHTGPLFNALQGQQNRIRTILVREESLAGVMAEVYGRLKRLPGVMIGQGPWVLGNGMIGILEGYLSSTPMLLLSDFSDLTQFNMHAPYQSGSGDYGGWDVRNGFKSVSKEVFSALDPVPAVQAVQLAIKHAMAGQKGPVAVLFGQNALIGTVSPDSTPRIYPTSRYLPPRPQGASIEAVGQVVAAIRAAKKPVIIAGNGVRIANGYSQLQTLVEALNVPLVTTASGKGCFPETHALSLGVFGPFGTAAANACVADSDFVVVIGSKLGASDTCREHPDLLDPERQTFAQIDIETKNAAWTFPVDYQLIGDAAIIMDDMKTALRAVRTDSQNNEGAKRVERFRKEHGYFNQAAYQSEDKPIHAQRVIGEMMKHLPAESIVTCDAGENRIFMTNLYQIKQAGGILMAAGAGPMGFAVPAALAAKLVHPDKVVVAVAGDGGFAMTMNGLMTAIEQDIPIITVVFNNSALGWVLHGRGAFTKFSDFDFAAIARSMGCHGIRVENPDKIGEALQEALVCGRPTVIDVAIGLENLTYEAVTSPLMRRKKASGEYQ